MAELLVSQPQNWGGRGVLGENGLLKAGQCLLFLFDGVQLFMIFLIGDN